jgi:hypothetical protein
LRPEKIVGQLGLYDKVLKKVNNDYYMAIKMKFPLIKDIIHENPLQLSHNLMVFEIFGPKTVAVRHFGS